jgi:hypothetical protein
MSLIGIKETHDRRESAGNPLMIGRFEQSRHYFSNGQIIQQVIETAHRKPAWSGEDFEHGPQLSGLVVANRPLTSLSPHRP